MRSAARITVASCVVVAVAGGVLAGASPAAAKVCDGVTVPCAIGDTGPGGGIVFYDAGAPQAWGRYLEAAPAGWFENPNSPAPVLILLPGIVRSVKVAADRGSAAVSWQAPASGGAPDSFRVVTDPASKGCSTSKRTCTVTGLAAGRSYAFSVVAVNAAGDGATSKAVSRRIPAAARPPAPKPVPSYRVFPRAAGGDPGKQWCPSGAAGYGVYLPTGTGIGTGRANTQIIIAACGTDTAAGLASSYYRGGGRDDWFLPSKDELNALYAQRAMVGGLAAVAFWSSSQFGDYANYAWLQWFFNYGNQFDNNKYDANRVRPVRAF